jgi:hypothetical protein
MAIIQSGNNSSTYMLVDPTNQAARVTLRPNEVTGSYRAALVSGTIPSNSTAGPLATFKYTGTGVCIIRSVQVGLNITTGYAAGGVKLGMYICRPLTTQGTGGTGTTATTFNSTGNKKRSSMAVPNATIVMTGTASGGITGDTVTEDSVAYNNILLQLPAAVTTSPVDGLRDFISPYNASAYPIVLGAGEGFRIKNDTAFAATGASTLTISVEWEEATSY